MDMFSKLAILLAVPAVVGAQQGLDSTGARPVSLAEALRLANDNNISNITAANTIRSTSNQVRAARAAFIPSLSASAGQSIRFGGSGSRVIGDQVVDNGASGTPPWSYSTGLSASMTLFDGGKMFSDVRARRADLNADMAAQVNTQFSVSQQVKTQYNAALAANEQLAAARAQLGVAQQQLAMTVARVNAGAANIADSLNSVVQVGNAQLAILTAQQSLRTANASLTRLVGTSYIITANPADTAAYAMAPIDSAAILALALEGPMIRQRRAEISAADASVKSAKGAYFPSLSASAGISGNGSNALYGLNNPCDPVAQRDSLAPPRCQQRYTYGRSVGLNFSFPIFNRFSRENAVQTAQIARENAEANLKDARLQAQQTVITQLGLLHNAAEQVRVQENSVRANEEALRVNQQRYNVGAGTFLDVLTSQSSLVSARQGLIQARLAYRNARAQIEAAIGRDLP
jgi:outer membrane protein